jgi:hypothetical protein
MNVLVTDDEASAPPIPTASIRSYLDRQLEVVTTDDGYQLRGGEQSLALLDNPRFEASVSCVTRDGQWRFNRLRGGNTEAISGSATVARYKSNALPGGTIELPNETKLRLRPPFTSQTWRVRRGARERVLEIRVAKGTWQIEFTPAASEIYHLPLLTMFAFHAMLVEIDTPTGGSTGPGV